MIANLQTAFLSGEWSKFAQGRADDPAYKIALNVCFNYIPVETGALVRRPGSRFLAPTHNGAVARLIPFTFQQNAPYNMEFSDGALRFFTGGVIVTTNDDVVVTSISTAKPAVVETATAYGWITNKQIVFKNLGTRCAVIQNRQLRITVIDDTHFSIDDPLTNDPIDGAEVDWHSSVGQVTVAQILQIGTVFSEDDLPLVRSVQAEQIAILLHPQHQTRYLTVATEPTPTEFATFDGPGPVTFIDGPYLDIITDCQVTVSGISGSITITLDGAIDHVNDGQGLLGSDVNRIVRLHSEPPFWDVATTYADGTVVSDLNGNYWVAHHSTPNDTTVNVGFLPSSYPNLWLTSPTSHIWQWATITAVTNATSATVYLSGGSLKYSNDVREWRLGAFSDTTGWPSCGTYHEGRLWLSGAVGNRIDGSCSATADPLSIFNFAPTDPLGQVADSNAIAATFSAPDVNTIFWMIPDQQGIVVGTQAGEWLVQATSLNAPLTPTSMQAHRVTKIGCANIEPRRTEHTIVFVQRFQRKVMEYFADVYSGKFSAPNLSSKAKHMTVGGIEELAYQQELAPIIWARTGDGSLIGATYKRDSLTTSQGPTFIGWHRHKLGSSRSVESICVGPSFDGNLDTLAMVTSDSATSVRNVEILTDIFDEASPLTDAWFLDNAVSPSSYVIQNVNNVDGVTLNGLWHLNGKTATVFAGGLDCGDYVVSNGSCFVPFGDGVSSGTGGGLFTAGYINSLTDGIAIVVGQNFMSQGQLLRPILPQDTGARAGPALGKTRRTHQFSALIENTVEISFGTSFDTLVPAAFKQPNGAAYAVNDSFSGVYHETLGDDYSYDSMLCWQVSRPFPANVLAVSQFIETQDR